MRRLHHFGKPLTIKKVNTAAIRKKKKKKRWPPPWRGALTCIGLILGGGVWFGGGRGDAKSFDAE